jgi:Transposase IS116/IS110/IS902 family
VSARRMLDALISGTHDPDVLADLAKGALRKKIPALREALQGRFTGHHALLIGQMLAQIDFLDETIGTLSERVEELTRPFSRELELLDTIPGVDKRAAEMLLAEIGPYMSRFLTDAHLASWGGICPDQRESGGKKHSAATRKGSICCGNISGPMLRSELCCSRSNVGRCCRGSGLPAQHSLGGLKALEEREQRGSWCQRPGLAIRRPNAIEHASLEFRTGLDVHVRRVERLVVEPQRDSRDGKPAENMLRSRSDRNRRLPNRARSARKQS